MMPSFLFMRRIATRTLGGVLWVLARLVLWKYKPTVIAVTGSVGKTTAKDTIYHALTDSFFVRRSEKSYNNDIGIPLTILGCATGGKNPLAWMRIIAEGVALIIFPNHYPRVLVLEVGADRPGDIARVAPRISPHIAVLTRFGDVPVHVEFFSSPEDVYKEKAELAKALRPKGILVVNNDDVRVRALGELFPGVRMTYGAHIPSVVTSEAAQVFYEDGAPAGMSFRVEYRGHSVPISVRGIVGEQYVSGSLAAFAVAAALGVNPVRIAQSLSRYEGTSGRMRLISGVRASVIIDDSYNSSPVAAEAALLTLGGIHARPGAKKIAVLGDMLELGVHTERAHERLGGIAAGVADVLILVGTYAHHVGRGALRAGYADDRIWYFDQTGAAGEKLAQILGEGDIALVKGSQGVRMERVVARVMAHPEEAPLLLVRQERRWKEK